MPDDVKSKISELEKELYSTTFKTHKVEDVLPQKEFTAAPVWNKEGDEASPLQDEVASMKHHLRMKKFVQFSIGFFVIAVLVAVFIWSRGSNIVSGENILIDISAPVAVAGGDPFETKFAVTNNNKVSIESATLFVEYPVGFYSVPNNIELRRISKDLGIVTAGQSISETVNALLYGEENTTKEVLVTLEYRMAGSNAVLKKTTTYSVRISSSPVNIKLSMPKEVSSGQEIEVVLDVTSNSKDPLAALVIEATFPLGFTFQSASPSPTYENNTWRIPGLAPQEKRTIKIRGVLEGQEGEEKIVKISVGTESPKDERFIGIIYNATLESSLLTKPFLGLDIAVNGNKSLDNAIALNKGVRVDVLWQSNNPVSVTDAIIEVKLKGEVLNRYSIYASGGGYYRSVDNTIVWEKSGSPELAVVEPGEKGSVTFSFSPVTLGVDSGRLIKNPQIILEVRAHTGKSNDIDALEGISAFITRNIKFETDLKITAKGLHFSGPFKNTGPIPPQADKETTYTITLSARNSVNSVSNTQVKTTLPIYVKWLGVTSPEGENLTFSENTGEIIWNVGRIPAGGSREASFQISLLPSISHINRAPLLTGDINITAMDDYTKTQVHDKKPPITTYIPSDPQFGPNDANVVD